MIISHSRQFIFFSNPKTGSESLRALLAPLAEEPVVPWRQVSRLYPFYPHMSPAEAKRVFDSRGWDFLSYTRVTAIRNPYPRLVSLYRMIGRVDGVWKMRARAGLANPAFTNWLRTTSPDGRGGGGRPYQRWRRFGTYSVNAWTKDRTGAPLVSHIIRLENLVCDGAPVFEQFGVDVSQAPSVNRAPKTDWRDYYDDACRALVAARYRAELEKFYPDLCLVLPVPSAA